MVVKQVFIDKIYEDMASRGLNTQPGTPAGTLTVSGDFEVRLNLDAASHVVTEGDSIDLIVSLTGPGATDGVSKNIYVKIKAAGGDAQDGTDYNLLLSHPDLVAINGDPGWLLLSKGQTSVTLSNPTILDNVDDGTEAPSETANFKIVDYKVENSWNSRASDFYHDDASVLTHGARTTTQNRSVNLLALDASPQIEVEIEIENKPSVVNKVVTASGGIEGWRSVEQFAPGQSINIFFDPYNIPDEFRLLDSSGGVLVDTGFIGYGSDYIDTVVVPRAGNGLLTIEVLTNDPGTAWEFAIRTVDLEDSPTAHAPLSATQVAGPLEMSAGNATLLEGNTRTAAANVEVRLVDETLRGHRLTWEIIGVDAKPADFDDFDDVSRASGAIRIGRRAEIGSLVASFELPSAAADRKDEGTETFDVVLRDARTGELVLNNDGSPVSARFSIVDGYVVSAAQVGTSGADVMSSRTQSATFIALEGNDKLNGTRGDDVADGGAGRDVLRMRGGDDSAVAGFGNDVVNGGGGSDTIYMSRLRSEIAIRELKSGALMIEDISPISLGRDKIKNVELLVLADQTLKLVADSEGATRRADFLVGDWGADVIRGGRGGDTLRGQGGSDRLFGGKGRDELHGEEGDDTLIGGRRADLFVFEENSDSAARDEIVDFQDGVDHIRLDGMDIFSIETDGSGAIVNLDNGDVIFLRNVDMDQIDSSDFI